MDCVGVGEHILVIGKNYARAKAEYAFLEQSFTPRDGLPPHGLFDRIMREVERPLISLTLEATRGNQIKAAELLGLNRNTLRKKIRELGVNVYRGARPV